VWLRESRIDRMLRSETADACGIVVMHGDRARAEQYYDEIATNTHLGISVRAAPGGDISTLPLLFEYLGRGDLVPAKLESDAPTLVEGMAAAGDILVTTFFAPKTSDVLTHGPARSYNWRRVVRIKSAPESSADRHHIDRAYVLFNVATNAPHAGPQGALSVVVQVILTARGDRHGMYAAYWILYKGRTGNWVLRNSFPASFDGGDFSDVPAPNEYFVPDACGQCHGQSRKGAALNLLDTDYLHDRVQDEDFEAVAQYNAPLFDAGDEVGSQQFQTAFGRIRKLNEEIKAQNRLAAAQDPFAATQTFRGKSIEKWVEQHQSADRFLEPHERGFASAGPDDAWPASQENDARLKLLERYCYRCHSTLGFNVFDRSFVLSNKSTMIQFLKSGCMPRDRQLDQDTVKMLSQAITDLQ
jgi:hypothetical protein